ncbi:MAG: MFS transporter, partial [Rhodoluna sp.]
PKVAKNSPVKDFAPLSKNIKSLIWVLTIFSAVNFPDALLLLHLSQENYSVTEVVGLYLLFNISYAALSFPAGLLADRIQPKYVYSLGLVFFAFAYGGLALTANKFAAILLVVLYGCFAAANDVVGKSWVSKLAENNQQLSVQARLQGSTGFAILFAGIWAGVIWNVGPGLGIVPLFISASLGLVAAVFVAATKL